MTLVPLILVLAITGLPATPPAALSTAAGLPQFHPGDARLTRVRAFLESVRPFVLHDLSRDGARIGFLRSSGGEVRAGVIDLVDETVRFIGRVAPSAPGVQLSPDGTQLLYRRQSTLRALDLDTDRTRVVARGLASRGAWSWLENGRISYVRFDRRIMLTSPGHRPSPTAATIPEVRSGRFARVWSRLLLQWHSVSPDASRALITDQRCRALLVNLRTGRRRVVAEDHLVPPRAWSPRGTQFVLTRMFGGDRPCFEGGPSHAEILFDQAGHPVARVLPRDLSHGHEVTWSNDGQWILIRVAPTGTQVARFEYLVAASIERRTITTVVPDRMASNAFVGPGDWIVFSRYRSRQAGSSEDARVVLAKLVEE